MFCIIWVAICSRGCNLDELSAVLGWKMSKSTQLPKFNSDDNNGSTKSETMTFFCKPSSHKNNGGESKSPVFSI